MYHDVPDWFKVERMNSPVVITKPAANATLVYLIWSCSVKNGEASIYHEFIRVIANILSFTHCEVEELVVDF